MYIMSIHNIINYKPNVCVFKMQQDAQNSTLKNLDWIPRNFKLLNGHEHLCELYNIWDLNLVLKCFMAAE